MTDRRFAVDFTLAHPTAEPDVIAPLVETLRLKAIDLGFLHVSELFTLKDEADLFTSDYGHRFFTLDTGPTRIPSAVCYFTCALPDDGPAEIGVERLPTEVECDEFVIQGGMLEWWKCGAVRTRELRRLSKLLYFAAELGFESSLTFAGLTLDYRRVAGKVEVQQTWDTVAVAD
ncbi:hypothetical protein [Limnoglobus roseus]|uniref:Uncharacterized protein n=1 Tax=Limnoglobus roseus TaxID=2598579 RepID=A0A5C1AL04_9BACT|nr:hypothetical protein [Limnoglobus roseus]QEL17864.1 hypothetical protein PX52LOC_04875 [Limnoglobus roseus]